VLTKALHSGSAWTCYLGRLRNAVEHPDGLSGKLVIANFTLGADRKIDEPTWHRKMDGKVPGEPSFIREDMETIIHSLLTLGENVFVSWASNHLPAHPANRLHRMPMQWLFPGRNLQAMP
jgi:hypothetical protein